jgi:hypothetical protein
MASDLERVDYMSVEELSDESDVEIIRAKRTCKQTMFNVAGVGLLAVGCLFVVVGGIGSIFGVKGDAHFDRTADNDQPQEAPALAGGPGGGPGVREMDLATTRSGYHPKDPSLMYSSAAPTYTFYVYRAQNDQSYPPLNANAAPLGGVLWYLQNEVVNRCDSGRGNGEFGFRRFKISRILRYKVTTKAPEPLFKKGMNFGTRVAFDSGKNTGSWEPWKDMNRNFDIYGYNVGCNVLGKGPYPQCPSADGSREGFCPIEYPDPMWFSFPGPCPSQDIHSKSSKCREEQPGGYCKSTPTGQGNCTWTYEDAGEIDIDQLVGIKEKFGSHHDFCKKGCLEYVKYGWGKDKGRCLSWWDNRFDVSKNKLRMDQVDNAFKAKYPHLPTEKDLPLPPCDFKQRAFYQGL